MGRIAFMEARRRGGVKPRASLPSPWCLLRPPLFPLGFLGGLRADARVAEPGLEPVEQAVRRRQLPRPRLGLRVEHHQARGVEEVLGTLRPGTSAAAARRDRRPCSEPPPMSRGSARSQAIGTRGGRTSNGIPSISPFRQLNPPSRMSPRRSRVSTPRLLQPLPGHGEGRAADEVEVVRGADVAVHAHREPADENAFVRSRGDRRGARRQPPGRADDDGARSRAPPRPGERVARFGREIEERGDALGPRLPDRALGGGDLQRGSAVSVDARERERPPLRPPGLPRP